MRSVTAQQRWILVAVILSSSIVFLDSTVVNVALGQIATELPSSVFAELEVQTFVVSAYMVSLSALLILAGALSDFHGRRRLFLIGLVGFAATSVLCGLAPTAELLILFRILQGAAGAILVPGALSIITASFTGEQQGRAFGLWAGASAATTILGPVVGGFLVDTISWRVAFLINAPFLAIALYAAIRYIPESRNERSSGRFDWLGAIVIAVAVGGLAFGVIRNEQQRWSDPLAWATLAVGAVATVIFPFLMRRSANPLVPLELFRSRNFSVTNLSTLVIYGALYVGGSFQAIFLLGTLGYTEAAAGAVFIPGSIFLALFSARFGALAGRYGARWFMAAGPALMALGTLWLVRLPPDSEPWRLMLGDPTTFLPPPSYLVDWLPSLLIFGLGLTIMVAPLTTALMTSVPVQNAGTASAINNAISRVGQPLVGALIFVAVSASFYSALAGRAPGLDVSSPEVRAAYAPLNRPPQTATSEQAIAVREASTDAFHFAMLVSVALLASGAVINAVGIRSLPPAAEPARGEPLRGDAVRAEPGATRTVSRS
jgi:EmrB/QacA subfamily drug resistance transporter